MFTLIDLPYAKDALAPVISAQTLEFHHGKHLQAYVDNLNKLLPGSAYESLSLEEIVKLSAKGLSIKERIKLFSEGLPEDVVKRTNESVFNNAGQILNHNLYFTQFSPADQVATEPTGKLASQIWKQWGSLDAFKEEFVAKGVGLFGSGWVWLSAQSNGILTITQEPGANNPITKDLKPLLTFDVWEHAYYLDYQNRRAAHLTELWKIVDWKKIEERY